MYNRPLKSSIRELNLEKDLELYKLISLKNINNKVTPNILLKNAINSNNSIFEDKELIETEWGPYSITVLKDTEEMAKFVYRFGDKYILVEGSYTITNKNMFLIVNASYKFVRPVKMSYINWVDV